MRTRMQRWMAPALITVLLGALSILTTRGLGSSAGATSPSLSATPTALSFGETTLGTSTGPLSFTMTNSSTNPLTVTFAFSGTGGNDYAWTFAPNCPTPADPATGMIVPLPASTSCTVEM